MTPELPPAGRDAPVRHVYRASPYAFTTDFKVDRRDPTVRDLLALKGNVRSTLGLGAGSELVRVVIFESRQRFDDFMRANYPELPERRAFFVKEDDNQLIVYACQGDRMREDLRHEATHALLHGSLPEVPIWLDEGLAQYFEADPDDAIGDHVRVQRLKDEAAQGWRPNLRQLEQLRDLWEMTADHYRESWLWIHYCLRSDDAHRRALLDHLSALRAGKPDRLSDRLAALAPRPDDALLAHLRSLTPTELPMPASPVVDGEDGDNVMERLGHRLLGRP